MERHPQQATMGALDPSRHGPEAAAPHVALLRQAMDLIADLDDDVYAATSSIAPGGGIGAHLRHCLDFYDCFLRGAPLGFIDYTARGRDRATSTDRDVALGRMARILLALERIPRGLQSVGVRPEEAEEGVWIPSTVARELEFVRTHTVHHFALIAILLRAAGIETDPSFGVAPSTLRARSQTAATHAVPSGSAERCPAS